MTFDEMAPRVLPFVPGCPEPTVIVHLVEAAKSFCRRSLVWNYQHAAIPTAIPVAGTVGAASDTLALSAYFASDALPITYAIFSGSLPGGLALNASTGEITGTPTTAGVFVAVISATDASGGIEKTSQITWDIASSITNVSHTYNKQGSASYVLTTPAATTIVRLLHVEIDGEANYAVRNGSLGRKFVRENLGPYLAVLSSDNVLTLTPAPTLAGQDLIVDMAVMPDDSALTEWPDELTEHVEFIAAGAIGTLCAMPKRTWTDLQTAEFQLGRFQRRASAVYHRVASTLVMPASARAAQF